MNAVEHAFSHQGALAKAIQGFSPRQAQLDMALEVAKAIELKNSLIVEAGTGTGKTFAYLIPALIANKAQAEKDAGQLKIIVSTGTKTFRNNYFIKIYR
jgi:ATP-dependent DNA helicase DinG